LGSTKFIWAGCLASSPWFATWTPARVAMAAPARVAALILIAAPADPELEAPRWYNRLADLRLVQLLISLDMVISKREIMPLRAELEAMRPAWEQIRTLVTVIHGAQDALVPPGHADFAERALVNAKVTSIRPEDTGHLIPWTKPGLITDALIRVLPEP